jgi:hypothetical protein
MSRGIHQNVGHLNLQSTPLPKTLRLLAYRRDLFHNKPSHGIPSPFHSDGTTTMSSYAVRSQQRGE